MLILEKDHGLNEVKYWFRQ